MTKAEKYFYSKDMVNLGPFDAEKISEITQKGEIKSSDWMFNKSKNCIVACSYTEFKEDFSKKENASTASISKSSSSEKSRKF